MGFKPSEVVVVTGASAGIGRAIVRKFAAEGAWVGCIARGHDGLEGAARDVEQSGGRAVVYPADVSDHDQVESAAAYIEDALGPIDVWVNNAMVSVLSPVMRMQPSEFRRITEVDYLGYVWGTLAALRRMKPRDHGSIVQIGSALAYRAIPLQSAYCAAKHAIVGFTESLRSELIHDGSNVKLSVVHLPGVNTPQFQWIRNRMPNTPRPVGACYQPEIAAEAAYWAAHHDRRELFVGLPTVKAVIGDKFIPGLLDHYLASTVYQGHQTDTPDDPNRRDNLFTPVPGDFGAHGPFDDEARDTSVQMWLSMHRKALLGLGVAAAAGLGLAWWIGHQRQDNADWADWADWRQIEASAEMVI